MNLKRKFIIWFRLMLRQKTDRAHLDRFRMLVCDNFFNCFSLQIEYQYYLKNANINVNINIKTLNEKLAIS